MRHDKKNILVTRPLDGRQREYARVLGLDPVTRPALEFEFPPYWDRVLKTINDHPKADWIFTSANAVKALAEMRKNGLQVPPNTALFAVGRKTGGALEDLGLEAQVPLQQDGEGLAKLVARESSSGEVIWLRGNRARRELPEILEENGIAVREVEVYKTLVRPVEMPRQAVEAILFYSPSAVEGFGEGEGFEGDLPPLFAIGSTTGEALREASGREVIESPRPDTRVLLKTVADHLFTRKPAS